VGYLQDVVATFTTMNHISSLQIVLRSEVCNLNQLTASHSIKYEGELQLFVLHKHWKIQWRAKLTISPIWQEQEPVRSRPHTYACCTFVCAQQIKPK
jgi:hypothetical protein